MIGQAISLRFIFSVVFLCALAIAARAQPLMQTSVRVDSQDANTVTFVVNFPAGIRQVTFFYGPVGQNMALTYHFNCIPTVTLRVDKTRVDAAGNAVRLTNINATNCRSIMGPNDRDEWTEFVVLDGFNLTAGVVGFAPPLVPADVEPTMRTRFIFAWWTFIWWWWTFIGPLVTISLLLYLIFRRRL